MGCGCRATDFSMDMQHGLPNKQDPLKAGGKRRKGGRGVSETCRRYVTAIRSSRVRAKTVPYHVPLTGVRVRARQTTEALKHTVFSRSRGAPNPRDLRHPWRVDC